MSGFDMEEFLKKLASAAKSQDNNDDDGAAESFEEFAKNFFKGVEEKNEESKGTKEVGGLAVNFSSKGKFTFKDNTVSFPAEVTIKLSPLPKNKTIAKAILTLMAYNMICGMTAGEILKMNEIPRVLFRFGPAGYWNLEKTQSGPKK